MELLGFFGALLIGLILGLIGSGGSVLAVPILTYLFLFDENPFYKNWNLEKKINFY